MSKTTKVIVVLPTYGAPFIYANKTYALKGDKAKRDEMMTDIRTVVGGTDIDKWTQSETSQFFIHPLFVREDTRWAYADKLIKKKSVDIYVNDNGMNECSPNMACPVRHKNFYGLSVITKEAIDRLPMVIRDAPMFGNIALVVPAVDIMSKIPALSLLPELWETTMDDGLYSPFEPEDEEEAERKQKEFDERGYDTRKMESTGQIYQTRMP